MASQILPVRSKAELTEEQLFCLEGCRNYKQYKHMRIGFEEGRCQFCDLDRTLNNVLFEDDLVMTWGVPQQFMREELLAHWLVVPKRHVRFEAELTTKENTSVLAAKQFMFSHFDYKGGLTHVREGDMCLNAGTVPHLHYNTFVPNGTAEVRIPVYKDPADREKNKARAAEFAVQYDAERVST